MTGESAPAVIDPSARLTAMSYNVLFDNPAEPKPPWSDRRAAVANVVRFHAPDVIGLQEAKHEQLRDVEESLPAYEWLAAGREAAGNAGEYAAVGYRPERFELVDEGTFWLSETPDEPGSVGWDAELPRLVRHVHLRERQRDESVFLFNTHFDHAGEAARRESAALLARRVADVAGDAPAVVTGDLNTTPAEEPYRILTDGGADDDGSPLRDSYRTATQPHHGPRTTMTDFEGLVPDRKIDHVLVTDDLDVRIHGVPADTAADGTYPSDHLPVVAELALETPDAERARAVQTVRESGAGSP